MSKMSSFSSLLANSWAVPGEELTVSLDFLCWVSLVKLSEVEEQLPSLPPSNTDDLDDPASLTTHYTKRDWISAGDKGLLVRSLLLNFIRDHPSIPPTAFLEAMNLVRTIFTKGTPEAEAVLRDVDCDVEIILVISYFLVIRAFYDNAFTEADFNKATEFRYAGFVQSSAWLSALEGFLDLDEDEQSDLAGMERSRLAMLNDLLSDIEYFQDIMDQSIEPALSAVYLGPVSMLDQSSLDDEHAFYEDSEVFEEEDLSFSLTAMAQEVMLLSRLATTASDEIADHGHEDASGRSGSSINVGLGLGLVGASAGVVDVPEPPKRVGASLYPVPRIPVAVLAPSVQVTKPTPPQLVRPAAYPSPPMPAPVMRKAVSAIVPMPFFAPSVLKHRRASFPLVKVLASGFQVTATPLIKSRASMADEPPLAPSSLIPAPAPPVHVTEPSSPSPVRATAYPSPPMPAPVMRHAASAMMPTPFFAPLPLKHRRATFPLPRIPPPVLQYTATPLIESRASMVEETPLSSSSPSPSFTVPHPLPTMHSLSSILFRDPSDWNGEHVEMRLLMDDVHAAIRYATSRKDMDEADDSFFSAEGASPSESEPTGSSQHYLEPSVVDEELLNDPIQSFNTSSSFEHIEVVSPSPILPRGVGVPSWVAEASQPAENVSRSGSGSPVPQRPSRPITNSDVSTLVGSISSFLKGKASYGTATPSATGSSVECLSMHRRTPFPVISAVSTTSAESERFANGSTPSSPDFAPNVSRHAPPPLTKTPSKLSSFIRKLRLSGSRSRSEDTVPTRTPPLVLPQMPGFHLIPVTAPSFPSSPSSQVAPYSPERLMEYEIFVPVPIVAEMLVTKDKRRWVEKLATPSKWFGRRTSKATLELLDI